MAYSRDDILQAAFEIVRSRGMSYLSARNIAKKLGCSTQPVYSTFKSMKEIESEVIRYAAQFTTEKFLRLEKNSYTFLEMGVGYVKMAMEETQLFQLLYNSGGISFDMRNNQGPISGELLVKDMKKTQRVGMLDTDTLYEILNDMWVFTHGLANLLMNSQEVRSEQEVRDRIFLFGDKLLRWVLHSKGITPSSTPDAQSPSI